MAKAAPSTDLSAASLGSPIRAELKESRLSFYGCPAVTDAGVVALSGLPRLRELHVSGPQITRECAAAFPARVRLEVGV
jgi:hypothetical protein